MSADDRKQLDVYLHQRGNSTSSNHSSLDLGMVAMMAVGGALVLISLLVGLILCMIGRRSKVSRYPRLVVRFSLKTLCYVWFYLLCVLLYQSCPA